MLRSNEPRRDQVEVVTNSLSLGIIGGNNCNIQSVMTLET